MQFAFDGCELNSATLELRRDGEVVHLEPQVLQVLLYLATNRDRVVTKIELLDSVWGDQFVSDSAISTRIKQARQAVGDDGRAQRVIRTAHGVGFRFIAEVIVEGDPTDGEGAASSENAVPGSPQRRVDVAVSGPLIGRGVDLNEVRRQLGQRRLVTIVGPGGIGKTHMLRHVGAEMGHEFADGATLVELAALQDGDAIGSALLDALRASEAQAMAADEASLRVLETREHLLLIDNAEHLLVPVAELCRSILQRCPRVSIVVTSRHRLNVAGESVHTLQPLRPDDAARLFVDLAGLPELANARPDVIALCGRVDGVPLAVEIIAARARHLSVGEIEDTLRHHLSAHRLDHSGDRIESVEEALLWSFEALSDVDRNVLQQLVVFSGSFDSRAAIAVTGQIDAIDSLLNLAEQSLIVAMPTEESSRFRLLEPVKMFAAEHQPQPTDAVGDHAHHYLRLAEEATELLASDSLDQSFAILRSDWPNIRAAFLTLRSRRDLEGMSRLVAAVTVYAELHILSEVRVWSSDTLKLADELDAAPDIDLLAAHIRFLAHAGELAGASALVATLPDELTPSATLAMFYDHWYAGRADQAQKLVVGWHEDGRLHGGYYSLAYDALALYAAIGLGETDFPAAERLIVAGALGGPTAELLAILAQAITAWFEGDLMRCVALCDKAVDAAATLRFGFFTSGFASFRSIVIASLDDSERARKGVVEGLEQGIETGAWSIVAAHLAIASKVLSDDGEDVLAAKMLGARDAAGYHVPASELIMQLVVGVLTERLGTRLEPLLESGRQLSLHDAAQLALRALESFDDA